jgi:hypothetical protein
MVCFSHLAGLLSVKTVDQIKMKVSLEPEDIIVPTMHHLHITHASDPITTLLCKLNHYKGAYLRAQSLPRYGSKDVWQLAFRMFTLARGSLRMCMWSCKAKASIR